jgi:xanthine/CO dehydrogenase XdhC/CoxF family maturation factor
VTANRPVTAVPSETSNRAVYHIPAMNEVFRELQTSLDLGRPAVLATVAATRGSTPRRPGARMLIRADGSFCGTIGGGCGEAEVIQAALDAHADGRPRLVQVDLTNPLDGDDKICGGVMDVFIERIAQ